MAISPQAATPAAKDIHYLSFQGGGGKGMAYLGAVEALQSIINGPSGSDLPIVNPWQSNKKNQIKGISGASAGAITALLLCIGYRASHINKVLNRQDFTTFFDKPQLGKHTRFYAEGKFVNAEIADDGKDHSAIIKFVGSLTDSVISGFFLDTEVYGVPLGPQDPFYKTLSIDPSKYIACFSNDFGLFVGFPAFRFMAALIDDFIKRTQASSGYKGQYSGATLPFSELVKLTHGVRLVVTGTNIWTKQSYYFSDTHTPDFPVAAACFISMSIPPAFKPVFLDCAVDNKDSIKSALYRGLWLDGGILNNFPLHAFDTQKFALDSGMLGFRIVEGFATGQAPPGSNPKVDLSKLGLSDYVAMLVETMLYPGTDGQIRSQAEEDQTIKIFAGKLTTMDFQPNQQDVKDAQKAAKQSVLARYPPKK